MIRRWLWPLAVCSSLALFGACERKPAVPPLTLFVAASLYPVVHEIAADYEEESGRVVRVSAASSSILAQQIDAGAQADVFLSADPLWTQHLEQRGRLHSVSVRELARSGLVLVAPAGRRFPVPTVGAEGGGLTAVISGRFAMADPEHVPLGRYTQAALLHAGWWDGVAAQAVRAADARATLALLERGECAAGVVYQSDAVTSGRVEVVFAIPESWHPPVLYTAAAVLGGDMKGAELFLTYLISPAVRARFASRGFMVPGEEQE